MRTLTGCLLLLLVWTTGAAWAQPAQPEQVGAHDDGGRTQTATHQCKDGHTILTRNISLQNAVQKYSFTYSGCQDPSHNGEHPSAEGNFGMPSPVASNWYHSGFLTMDINGKDVMRQDLAEMRITETGERGGFQTIWQHPDAEVSLRTILLPGSNHVLCLMKWEPKAGATLKNVSIRLRCYPSFFTSARARKGERHVKSPRIDVQEPNALDISPGQDPWLLYHDAIFDVARGEGDGPCAVAFEQANLQGGKVYVGDYAVMTHFNVKPEAGSFRFALYDLAGSTNAEALAYLQAHGMEDLAQLLSTDFRPKVVRELDVARTKAEAVQLLADAAEDGTALRPKVEAVVKQVEELAARGQAGDWKAEADLADVVRNSEDLFWKLKTYAVLNGG